MATPAVFDTISEEKEGSNCIVCFEPQRIGKSYSSISPSTYGSMARTSPHTILPCCQRILCDECMCAIVRTNVNEGHVQILCPHPSCGQALPKGTVVRYMNQETRQKYERFLVNLEGGKSRRTCPNCCQITNHVVPRRFHLKEEDLKITCVSCDFEWCFKCHAPWHQGISCKAFREGEKQFKKWTKELDQHGNNNCQKCPTCRVWIQRSEGCNQMTCNRCDTNFCYYCGCRFLEVEVFDDLYLFEHDSELNIWGCDRTFLPDHPALRKFIRGGYLGVKLTYLMAYPALLVGAGVLVIVGGIIILPVYGVCKLHSLHVHRRKSNRLLTRRR